MEPIITRTDLDEFRAEAEALMTSRARVMRKTGAYTRVNGLDVPAWIVVVPEGPFKLSAASVRGVTVEGVLYEKANGVGHFPAAIPEVKTDDLIDITVGEWAGTVWSIVSSDKKDWATARRVPVDQTARPEEWV